MASESENGSQTKRGRKKLLHQSILKQMEFYFSPSNLAKDRWLSNKLNEEECIHLTEFLKFNKIKALTNNVNDLAKALKKSTILTVTEDMKVARTQPVKFKENEEDYVIYVEQVPPDADHDWISGVFSVYGKIDYISLPKFKNSNKCKGFAFIEFAEIESAQRAIQDYQEKGNYLSTDIAPEELLSISNYEGNNNAIRREKQHTDVEMPSRNEIDLSCNDQSDANNTSKKRKNSENFDDEQEQKKVKIDSASEDLSTHQEATDNSTKEEDTEAEQQDDGETKKKKNRKKKNKKKKYKENNEICVLQILSKRDWKRLRNKYLNMQKEKMKQLKKHLYMSQKKSDFKQNGVQKNKNEKLSQVNKEDKSVNDKKSDQIPFTAGLIVKVKFDDPVVDVKAVKNEMRKNASIKYVDVKEGVQQVYLRFESPESALEFCEGSSFPKTKLLKGQKEIDYWDKLQKQREEKFSKKNKKKERGKDKLMKKAESILGKHIIFDEI